MKLNRFILLYAFDFKQSETADENPALRANRSLQVSWAVAGWGGGGGVRHTQ